MPVRIFFRGLVLFRFPKEGPDAGKIVAELISDRTVGPPKGAPTAPAPHPHHHQAEIQVLTGAGPAVPTPLLLDSRINIIAPAGATANREIERSQSWEDHVPKLADIARRSAYPALQGGTKPTGNRYLHSTVTINGGLLRARNPVIWDASGFPLVAATPSGATAATPAELKFMGSDVRGHMANECVVEIDADSVDIVGDVDARAKGTHRPTGQPNPHTSSNTVEILINNFEYQRVKPVPWGLDFQWLFLRAGYPEVDLSTAPGNEFNNYVARGRAYDPDLWAEDERTLLPNTPTGLPFPYLVENPLTPLIPLNSRRPRTEIDSRPVCVPGEE